MGRRLSPARVSGTSEQLEGAPEGEGQPGGSLLSHIDMPQPDEEIVGSFVPIVGWVWERSGVEWVEARTSKGVTVATRVMRPDVAEHFGDPDAVQSGFYATVERGLWDGECELWAGLGSGEPVMFTKVAVSLDQTAFGVVHQRLLEILACPSCHASIEAQQRTCGRCARPFEWMGEVPSFLGLTTSLMARGEPVSRNPALENIAGEYFDLDGGGLFLDDGAGWPPRGHPAVVQLEVERFPGTNVVGEGSELPFDDATFDGVMSHAVMEHVPDPFGYAKELVRVLKPGARFIVHSAFLQPVHAYPNHYFNTTLEGLRLLFGGTNIIEAGVAPFQHPWLALEWMLRSYRQGFTNDEDRSRFEQMRIGDLLGDAAEDRPMSQFQALREEAVRELAAGVYVLGER